MTDTRDPRTELLHAAVDSVVLRGLADLSLRQLADEIGTSHRMLIYHFGSKEGLVTEVVREMDRRLYEQAWPEASAKADDPAAASRAVFRHVTAPRRRDEQLLMLEMYVAAIRGKAGTESLVEHFGDWAAASASQAGWLGDDALRQSRLLAAAVRGLMIELMITGDRRAVQDAFERYLELAAQDPRMPAGA